MRPHRIQLEDYHAAPSIGRVERIGMNPDRAADYIVGVDFSTLDHLTLGCGQYRYLVDLITCMTEDPLRGVRVKLFGSKAEPVPELRSAWLAGKLDYRQISRSRGRWAYLADHVRYSM